MPAETLALSPGPLSVVRGDPDLAGHSLFEPAAGSTAGFPIWSAANHFGDGEYALPVHISVPATVEVTAASLILTIRGTAP